MNELKPLQCKKAAVSREVAILVLIGLAAFALRMLFVHVPFDRDEGIYAYIGKELLGGSVLYKDVIDIKPPGIYYLYALAIATFGGTVEGVRTFTAIYSLATLGAVYWLARSVYGVVAAIGAAILFAVFSCAPLTEGCGSNAEVFMVLPLMLGVIIFLRGAEKEDRRLLFWSGFCGAAAILVKTVALPYGVVLFGAAFFMRRNGASLRVRLVDAASYLAPYLLMALLTGLFFYGQGALDNFIYWNFSLPLLYRKEEVILSYSVLQVIKVLAPEFLLLTLLALPTAVWLVITRCNFKNIVLVLLVTASCLGIWLPGKFFPHYFIQLFPVLAVLGGIGLARCLEIRGAMLYFVAVIAIASLVYFGASDAKYFVKFTPQEVSKAKFGTIFIDAARIADYVRQDTDARDYIFQWGFEPEIYFLADRRAPVPHVSTPTMIFAKNPWTEVIVMIESLNNKKPKYIIVDPNLTGYPGEVSVGEILAADYQFVNRIGYAQVYRRK